MRRAHLAILRLPDDAPDRRTSLADLRAALCLETGVAIDDIDPASGHDYSRAAYEDVRRQWRGLLAEDPDSPWAARNYAEVRALWLAHRPDWDDDWLAPEAPVPVLVPLFELEPVQTTTTKEN